MWIPVLAVMLGGIVWINAGTLRLSTRSSLTIQRADEAQAEIVNLNAALQQEDSQVQIAATRTLGMKQENPAQVTFLRALAPTR
jgi:cell division protein FtsL